MLADFRQYYNISILRLIEYANNQSERVPEISAYEAGILCSQLPRGSRYMSEINENLAWEDTNYILSKIEYNLRTIIYGFFTKKGKVPKSEKPLMPRNKKSGKKDLSLEVDGYALQPVTREEFDKRKEALKKGSVTENG